MNKLETIKDIILQHDQEIKFSDPVEVLLPQGVFQCYSVSAHENEGVWLMDGAGEWHGPLLSSQINAEQVIQSLFKRLKNMSRKAA